MLSTSLPIRKMQEYRRGVPLGVVANMLNTDIMISKFKLHSCYYVHFYANTQGKDKNILIP